MWLLAMMFAVDSFLGLGISTILFDLITGLFSGGA